MSAATDAAVPELDAIRRGVAPGATESERSDGMRACRTLLARMEGTPSAVALSTDVVSHVLSALRGMSAEQILDLAISRMRAALPTEATAPPAQLRINMIKLPAS